MGDTRGSNALPVRTLAAGALVIAAVVGAVLVVRPRPARIALSGGASAQASAGGTGIDDLLQARAAAMKEPSAAPVRLRHAAMLERFHFIEAARREYSELLPTNPDDAAMLRACARVRLLQGAPAEAAGLLLKAADRSREARLEAAEALRLAGEPRQCIDLLREEGVPSPEAARSIAAAWLDLRQPARALAELEPLTRRAPGDGEAQLLLGRALCQEGGAAAAARALEALSRAAGVLGESGPVLHAVGEAAERRGDDGTAARSYREAAQSDPRFACGYRHVAAILGRTSARDPALRAAALRYRGLYARAVQDETAALNIFSQEINLQPGFVPAHLDAAQSSLELGRPDQAIRILRQGLKRRGDQAEFWSMLALTSNDWNRPSEALAAVRGLETSGGPRVLGQVRLLEGRIYLKAQEPERAITAFEAAIAMNPEDAGAQYWLGKAILEGASDPAQAARAARYLQEGVESDPESPAGWLALGEAQVRAEQVEPAVAALERALELNPRRPEGYPLLAQALRQRGDLAEAAAAMSLYSDRNALIKREESLLRAKASEKRSLALARFYLDTGELEAARRVLLPVLRGRSRPAAAAKMLRTIDAVLGVPHT